MTKIRLALIVSIMIIFVATPLLFAKSAEAAKKLYVGGAFALTGAYAEDMAAALTAYQDYVKYVNETKNLAPWRNEKWPADITLEMLCRDDEIKPAKTMTIYEELKAKGILVYRGSASATLLALKDRFKEDKMGTTSGPCGPYLLVPAGGTVFTYFPIYTDSLAAIADWFKENWKENRKPRVAYLTAESAMGRSIEIPEMKAYLEKIGYEFVGIQYMPVVPVSPPTTQLMWLKKNGVDLALGIMVNPGTQPTIKEMVRLGMGPHLDYKMTLGVGPGGHTAIFAQAMGELGDGYVCAGSFPNWDDPCPGMRFVNELQKKYHTKRTTSI